MKRLLAIVAVHLIILAISFSATRVVQTPDLYDGQMISDETVIPTGSATDCDSATVVALTDGTRQQLAVNDVKRPSLLNSRFVGSCSLFGLLSSSASLTSVAPHLRPHLLTLSARCEVLRV